MKARTALTLGKTYRQDQALDWGFLTSRGQPPGKAKSAQSPRMAAGPCGARSGRPLRGLRVETGVILEGIVTTLSPGETS